MADRDNFIKKIQFKFELDRNTLNRSKEEAQNALKDVKIFSDGIFDKNALKKLSDEIEKSLNTKSMTQNLREVVRLLKGAGQLEAAKKLYEEASEDREVRKALKDLFESPIKEVAKSTNKSRLLRTLGLDEGTLKESGLKAALAERGINQFWDNVDKGIQKIKQSFSEFFQSIIKEMTDTLNSILDYTITDYKYSETAWGAYAETGLTGAQAYGLNRAMERVGVDNITDLNKWFAIAGEGAEQRFNELMSRYEQQYETDLEIAEMYQEWQEEFQDFKEELSQDLLEWFVNNKDTVKRVLEGLLSFMEWIVEAIGSIISFFGGDVGSNDIISSSDRVSNTITEGSTFTTNNAVAKIYVNGGSGQAIGETAYQYLQSKLGIA